MSDWISLATLGLAAITLVFVVRADVVQRRHAPRVQLSVTQFGIATCSDGAERHVWEISNAGSETADLQLKTVRCRVEPTAEYPSFRVVAPGQSRQLLVQSTDFESAWILLMWRQSRDRRWVDFQWWAPEAGTELEEERARQLRPLKRALGRRFRRRRRTVQAVGPGGVAATRVRTRSKRLRQDLQTAASLADQPTVSPKDAPHPH